MVPADREKTAADAKAFAMIPGVTATVVGPIPAKDGKAVKTIVPIVVGASGWDSVAAVAERIRALASTGAPGLIVHITGPGGIAADSAASFKGIDTTLLLFTVGVVVVILLVTYRSPTLWLLPVLTAGMALTTAQ